MNYALALLICLFVMVSIIFIVLTVRMYILSKKTVPPVIIVPPSNQECQPPLNTLIDISGLPNCTNPSLALLGSKYIESINMIVGQTQVPFISACSSACVGGFDSSKLKCINQEYQADFDRCVNLTSPSGCSSLSRPVAHDSENYYYINNYGEANCFAS